MEQNMIILYYTYFKCIIVQDFKKFKKILKKDVKSNYPYGNNYGNILPVW
jgi:hypothetical protein